MECAKCGATAGAGARFCAACGTPLERRCASCGIPAALGARFCSGCGASLGGLASSAAAPAPAAVGADGERRQLTVLFADVVGATSLSGRLDPEALRALLRQYQAVCVESVTRYGGTLHQYAGDGVLAYFGYPEAHDNDAERAVLAGLAIVAGVRRLTAERRARGEPGVSARVGVHTGLVVVGEMGAGDAREVHAIGETPNVAARIQSEAAPDSVCVSDDTLRLTGARFQSRALGTRDMKGVARALPLHAVEGVLDREGGHDGGERAAAPLVGREAELGVLLERWALARQGRGQAVLLSGEGGIGKSRLLAEFRRRGDVRAADWRNVFCSPFAQNSALQPMIDLIDRALARAAPAPAGARERAEALRVLMQASGLADDTAFALVAALAGAGEEHEESLRALAPDQRRRRTMDALVAWLHADARQRPLVLVVEDLHWIDASTRDLVGALLDRLADVPMLVVLTFRPEFVPSWALHGHVAMVALSRLASAQVEAIAANAAGGRALPAEVLAEVARRTDGVPLFVEELTKALIASGLLRVRGSALEVAAGGIARAEIPTTLRDSLTARLDRLGPAKAVAQLGAVLGREFDYALLHAVAEIPEAELEARLADLNRAEIIHQRGVPPRSHYIFKHALIQEAAYDTLLHSARQAHHRRVARVLEERFADLVQARPELAAHHYSRALMPAEALAHWQRAGETAVARSGYVEAIGHLQTALEQLELLPDTPARAETELALRVKVGPAVAALKGFNHSENGANYERACRLAEVLGDRPDRFIAMWGDWLYKTTSGQAQAASRRSEDLVALSRRLGDEAFILQAHHARWTNNFVLGDMGLSRADTLEGIRLYDGARHRDHKHLYGGHDPGVCALGVGANAAWAVGQVRESLRLADEVVAHALELDHPFSLALAYSWASCALHCAGVPEKGRAHAEALVQVCERHGFVQWRGLGKVTAGAAHVALGSTAFGLKLVEDGLETHRALGQKSFIAFLNAVGAEAHLAAGNHGRAAELLANAAQLARELQFGWHLPEIERRIAEISLQAGKIELPEAINRLEAAARLAAGQSAPMLQWRAELSLARLYLDAGRRAEARVRLEGIVAAAAQAAPPELDDAKALLGAA